MYSRPYNRKEILEKYSKDTSDNLLKDELHIWRADNGIELIHKEKTYKEQNRIWKNWQEMSEEYKNISDKKSIEFFGINNRENHLKIMNDWKKKRIFTLISVFLIFILITIGIYLSFPKQKQICGVYEKGFIEIGQKILKVDIADNDCKRILGLSYRKSISDNEGMFFIFENIDRHGFWMKDMSFPIEIIWLDKDFVVTDIEANVLPDTFPKIFYPKDENALYVLEINALMSKKLDLNIGEKIKMQK